MPLVHGGARILRQASDNGTLIRQFLLGDLSPEERVAIEDEFFSDDNLFAEMLIVEAELIDAYVRGELDPRQRAGFEKQLLTSERRQARVKRARAFINTMARMPLVPPAKTESWWRSLFALPGQNPALQFGLAAVVVLSVLLAWVVFQKTRPSGEPERAQTEQTTPPQPQGTANESKPDNQRNGVPSDKEGTVAGGQNQATPQTPVDKGSPPTPPAKQSAPPVVATFLLSSGLVRGAGGPISLSIPPEASQVRLRLPLEGNPYQKYRAMLTTPGGRKLWSGNIANAATAKTSREISLNLPAGLLTNGDYVMELYGANAKSSFEPVANYSFRVNRR